MGELRSFQFPPHTASPSHHTLLPCVSTAAAPHSPHLLCTTPETADTSNCCSSLVSPRPASGSVCASYSKLTAAWGQFPHPGAKHEGPSHAFQMVLALLALGQGTAPLLSSWDGGAGQV